MYVEIQFDDKRLEQVMKELEEAEEKIYRCYQSLKDLKKVVVKSGCEDSQPES